MRAEFPRRPVTGQEHPQAGVSGVHGGRAPVGQIQRLNHILDSQEE
jgi:hypothetical protein